MGIFSRVEGKMEDTFEGAADKMFDAPISPVQIAKKAEKQMRREKMVGAGKQYAPTLYTVLVNPDDDRRLFGYYPTLAGETETYLAAKASEQGLMMDGQPLVRFIVDEGLRHGKFDVIAEAVAAPIISQLRDEEMQRYGLGDGSYGAEVAYPAQRFGHNSAAVPAEPRFNQPQEQASWNRQGYDDYGYEQNQSPAPYRAEQQNAAYAPANPAYNQAQPQPQGYGAAGAAAAYGAAAGAAGAAVGYGAGQAMSNAPSQQQGAQTMVFNGGSQAAADGNHPGSARLIDTTANRTYMLNNARNTVGRESRNDITVPDINASRSHAEITLSAQGVWIITDLDSTNGTYVNGRAIASQPLNEGDHISIGTTELVFTFA